MSNKSAFLGILGLLVAAAVLGAVSQTGEDLFQKALRLETNEGKWTEAIGLYQAILKQFPENRQLAAEAQFRIGQCYERLGNQEAKNAYQTVVRDYGEQKEIVAKAQARLSGLARPSESPAEPEGIRIKQVWVRPYMDYLGSVSPDGRLLSFVHWGEGDLAIRELTTGEERLLTHDADVTNAPQHFAMDPLFSRDGTRIAYSWWDKDHTSDLLLIDVHRPSPRRLYHREGEEVYPAAWLSDDTLLVLRRVYETKSRDICSLNISDGTVRELKTYFQEDPRELCCSPDGRSIAYDFANESDNRKRDINLLAALGGPETPLVKHPADDKVLGWVPGRNEFLFLSDRSGTWDLWALPVVGGRPSGPEKRIYTDIGDVDPVGVAQNGDCFIGFVRRINRTLIAPFDQATGEIDETRARSLLGSPWSVGWSPDGRFLTYGRNIEDLKTGEKRKFAENLAFSHPPSWSPDGNTILVIGRDKDKIRAEGYKGGVYAVDVKTGGVTEVLRLSDYQYTAPGDDAFPLSDVQWSSDGKSFFYLFFRDRLVRHDLVTGEDTVLYRHPSFARGVLKRSPDGKSLLLSTRSPEKKKDRLFTIPIEGGQEKDLCSTQGIDGAMWSPDGRYVYFQKHKGWETTFWRVLAEGGLPQQIWRSENRAEFFEIHPRGNEIALARSDNTTEIRVIKNLVQELEKAYPISK
jgi:Tol biopolymer transport system component